MIRWLIVIALLLPACVLAHDPDVPDTVWVAKGALNVAHMDWTAQTTTDLTYPRAYTYHAKADDTEFVALAPFNWDIASTAYGSRVTIDSAKFVLHVSSGGGTVSNNWYVRWYQVKRTMNLAYVCWDNYAFGYAWQDDGAWGALDAESTPLWVDTIAGASNYPAISSQDITTYARQCYYDSISDKGLLCRIFFHGSESGDRDKSMNFHDTTYADTLRPFVLLYWTLGPLPMENVTVMRILDIGDTITNVSMAHEPTFQVTPPFYNGSNTGFERKALIRVGDSLLPDWIEGGFVQQNDIRVMLAPPVGGHYGVYADTVKLYVYPMLQDWQVTTGDVSGKVPNWKERTADDNWADTLTGPYPDGASADSIPCDSLLVGVTPNTWYTINVPDTLIEQWCDGGDNYGLLIMAADSGDGGKHTRYFYSHNATSESVHPDVRFLIHGAITPPVGGLRETEGATAVLDSYDGTSPLEEIE